MSIACAATVLTACGGSAPEGDAAAYFSESGAMHAAPGSALQAPLGTESESFGNFNSNIWDEHDWYECNCSVDPEKPPTSTPWETAS